MTDKELIEVLGHLKVKTGSLACFGCGHEHNCGIHGCAIIRHAKDRINALSRLADDRLDALTASPWISVDGRLPETDESVLAIVSGKPKSNITLVDAPEVVSYCRDTEEWFIDAYPEWDNPKVTYWMPIPKMLGEER